LNLFLRKHGFEIDKAQKMDLARRMLGVLWERRNEAGAGDFSRMAWLAIHLGQESVARDHVRLGMEMDSDNEHLLNLARHLGKA
jgi:hypothetical protein